LGEKRLGKQTIRLANPPSIIATSSIAGPKEGDGNFKIYYDVILEDELWGEDSWEKAESKLIKETYFTVVEKSGKSLNEIDYIVAGDLLNQCTASIFGLRSTNVSFFGVYGACSTMAESLSLGSMLIDGGFGKNIVCLTSSHFCSAEKQFRYPLELGSQKSPSSQWTVTGSGGIFLSEEGTGPFVKMITTGKIVDMGIKDPNNMGAAMAPAAADTIVCHFKDTGLDFTDYDIVITGDLGKIGHSLCKEMLEFNGYETKGKLYDCGMMIFNTQSQEVFSGGSGCGCAAITLAGYLYKEMLKGSLKNILFVATGALLSTTTSQQGESIPGIAHAVSLSNLK
jgi:stage V sporulation protein AD